MRMVFSAGLEARLYGRQRCLPLRWSQASLPDVEGGIPAARIKTWPCLKFYEVCQMRVFVYAHGFFRRAGKPGSTAGRMPAATVESGILPDVEGGILPPGSKHGLAKAFSSFAKRSVVCTVFSAGLEARLYGRQGCLPLRCYCCRPVALLHFQASGRGQKPALTGLCSTYAANRACSESSRIQ